MERRLAIIVTVSLAPAERAGTGGEERTHTDNISAHGARIFSRHPWELGDKVRVTPVNEESTACGKVVYCHRLADDRYDIRVTFQDRPVTWSVALRYDVIQISPFAKIKSTLRALTSLFQLEH